MKRAAMCVCIVLFLFSAWMMAKYGIDNYKTQKVLKEAQKTYYAQPAPSVQQPETGLSSNLSPNTTDNASRGMPDVKKSIQAKFLDLLKVNKDVVGWIKIPGTVIDYPVAQAQDNKYYLDHNIAGEVSKTGSIFMDFRNIREGDNKNIILYGHNMKNGTMFNNLMKYKKEDFFKENRIISFDNIYEDQRWEIFSVYITDVKFNYIKTNFDTTEEYVEFLNQLSAKSMYKTGIQLNENDRIITLSTCTYEYNDARFVIHARLIK